MYLLSPFSRKMISLMLSLTLLFGLLPPGWYGEASLVRAEQKRANDLDTLLAQPVPVWNEPEPAIQQTTYKTIQTHQVLKERPELKAATGGGGSHLAVEQEQLLVLGASPASVQLRWRDTLSAWIAEQEGTPAQPISGYQVKVSAKNVVSGERYELRGTQRNSSGLNQFAWNGKDIGGRELPDGAYEWYLTAVAESVTFTVPPAQQGGAPTSEVKAVPAYASEHRIVLIDRKSPVIAGVQSLGRGTTVVELKDDTSGIASVTFSTGGTVTFADHPLHVVVPVQTGNAETLEVTVKDAAGRETKETFGVMSVIAHLGSKDFWPNAAGTVGGESYTLNLFSGGGTFSLPGMTQPGDGPALSAALTYNHQMRSSGLLGRGWTLSFDSALVQWQDQDIMWRDEEGTEHWAGLPGKDMRRLSAAIFRPIRG